MTHLESCTYQILEPEFKALLFCIIPDWCAYLVEHAAVPHHTALGMHVLTAALPLYCDNALHFWGDGQLPTQFSSEILEQRQKRWHLSSGGYTWTPDTCSWARPTVHYL